jgi:ribosomal protein S18 acetylase RimI-like enzyme
MKKIEYIEKGIKDLDIVGPLWEKLNEHHLVRSRNFRKHFEEMTWDVRKKELLEKCRNGLLRIDLAKDGKAGTFIGYCVSTINEKKVGEIESIFIEADYRRAGIGGNFMKKALNWMAAHSIEHRVIAVAAGNEEAYGFYAKYKFYPRASILMQVKEE